MKKSIFVSYPKNISEKDKIWYEPYLTYDWTPLKTLKLKNIFVTFSGFCIDSKGLISESHHAYSQQHKDYINDASYYYFNALDNPQNLITLDTDDIYVVIHHPWFNYYHWIMESVFRLWMVRKKLDHLILILPEHYKYADFITGSLEPFHINKIYYIPEGKSLMVQNIYLPQIKPVCDSYSKYFLNQVRKYYVDYILFEKIISTPKIEKLYISRKLAIRRKVINEAEIIQVAEKWGFTVFYPENFTFLEQVSIFRYVKYLIGEHGSGLTNMLFMSKNTSVLELHKTKTNELNHPSPLFWYMAEALGINYFHQICSTWGEEDYFQGDYKVDIGLLELNIEKMLSYTSIRKII